MGTVVLFLFPFSFSFREHIDDNVLIELLLLVVVVGGRGGVVVRGGGGGAIVCCCCWLMGIEVVGQLHSFFLPWASACCFPFHFMSRWW